MSRRGSTRDESIANQTKVFRKWCNLHLAKAEGADDLVMEDLSDDLSSGVKLLKLLEVLSGKTVRDVAGRPINMKPKMRIHLMENCSLIFKFVQKEGMRVVNIGAEDIVDANQMLILGLIWTAMLHYTASDSQEQKNKKAAVLSWCQEATKPYDGVEIANFHRSFADGRAFCALVASLDSSTLDYDSVGGDARENLDLAFSAMPNAGVSCILDRDDIMEEDTPDEKSVFAQVSLMYKRAEAQRAEAAKQLEGLAKLIEDYNAANAAVRSVVEKNEPLAADAAADEAALAAAVAELEAQQEALAGAAELRRSIEERLAALPEGGAAPAALDEDASGAHAALLAKLQEKLAARADEKKAAQEALDALKARLEEVRRQTVDIDGRAASTEAAADSADEETVAEALEAGRTELGNAHGALASAEELSKEIDAFCAGRDDAGPAVECETTMDGISAAVARLNGAVAALSTREKELAQARYKANSLIEEFNRKDETANEGIAAAEEKKRAADGAGLSPFERAAECEAVRASAAALEAPVASVEELAPAVEAELGALDEPLQSKMRGLVTGDAAATRARLEALLEALATDALEAETALVQDPNAKLISVTTYFLRFAEGDGSAKYVEVEKPRVARYAELGMLAVEASDDDLAAMAQS